MGDNSKNLGKFLHKAKPKEEAALLQAPKVNARVVPNKTPSKAGGSGGVRG